MAAIVKTLTVLGLDTLQVSVEVDLSNGLPGLIIVGLPDRSIDESRERVRSAIRAAGCQLPTQRIVVNLAPADVRKEGPIFDLPIAIAILTAAGQVPPNDFVWLGELGLNGELRPARGVLAGVSALTGSRQTIFVPAANAAEAALVSGVVVKPLRNLQEAVDHLKGEGVVPDFRPGNRRIIHEPLALDFAEIRGQARAKRALEIAAAGGHNVLLSGPPGTGKTLLAKALPGILPELSEPEALEVTKIFSVAGLLRSGTLISQRPFRSPHHSVSLAGLIGGGSVPRPGELTLAHRGVLYLDEIPQFPMHVLEALRGPLEDGWVRITRAQYTLRYPTECMLLASQNPCPCGFADDATARCTCAPVLRERYSQRLSGPIRDRFDISAEVPRLSYAQLGMRDGESSDQIRGRVAEARQRQQDRFGEPRTNAAIRVGELERHCRLEGASEQLLAEAVDRWQLSVRGCHRVLKVARTIADLAGEPNLTEAAVAEALQYRARANVPA